MAETHTPETVDRVSRDDYDKFEKKKRRELRRKRGVIRWITYGFGRVVSLGIAYEVRDDWQRIRRIRDITHARLFKPGAVDRDVAVQLATASAYLELARHTKDLAETWSLVNQASEILCELAESDEEREAIAKRFDTWEPILERWLKELYEDDADSKKAGETVRTKLKEERDAVADDPCRKVAVHTRHWQLVNQWISFTRRIWRLALVILVVTLVLAIGVAEYLYVPETAVAADGAGPAGGAEGTGGGGAGGAGGGGGGDAGGNGDADTPVPVTPFPFIWISVLGLFGGALSVMMTARDRKVTAVTYGQIRSEMFIRLVLGAAGAFVVYILLNVPGLFDEQISTFVKSEVFGFMMLGIVAGFSEQLFKRALERAARKFPTAAGKPGNES